MRLAIFGGSFDPPHVGHVLAVEYLTCIGAVDRILVVPVFDHALAKDLSPFETRLRLCEVAFGSKDSVDVSDIEAHLPRPSYTLRTLLALQELHPEAELRLVIGADVLVETGKWHRFDQVEKIAPPLVLGRRGVDSKGDLPAVLPDVSSTEVRRWAKSDRTEHQRLLQLMTPLSVRELIRAEGLYR